MDIIDTIGAASSAVSEAEKIANGVSAEKPELEKTVSDLHEALGKLSADVSRIIAAWPSLTGESLK